MGSWKEGIGKGIIVGGVCFDCCDEARVVCEWFQGRLWVVCKVSGWTVCGVTGVTVDCVQCDRCHGGLCAV